MISIWGILNACCIAWLVLTFDLQQKKKLSELSLIVRMMIKGSLKIFVKTKNELKFSECFICSIDFLKSVSGTASGAKKRVP